MKVNPYTLERIPPGKDGTLVESWYFYEDEVMIVMGNENAVRPRAEIFLNNNPRCSVHLENVARGEIWDKSSIP